MSTIETKKVMLMAISFVAIVSFAQQESKEIFDSMKLVAPGAKLNKVSGQFSFTEGPAVAKVKNGWLIYYDVYQKKKYGASFTKDFKNFVQADSLISVPEGHKHGTIVKVTLPRQRLKTLSAAR